MSAAQNFGADVRDLAGFHFISNQTFFPFPQAPFLAMPLIHEVFGTLLCTFHASKDQEYVPWVSCGPTANDVPLTTHGRSFLEEREETLTGIGAPKNGKRRDDSTQSRPTAALVRCDAMRCDRWPCISTLPALALALAPALAASGVMFSANFFSLSPFVRSHS